MERPYQEALSEALEKVEFPVRIVDERGIAVFMNTYMKEIFGDLVGRKADFIFNADSASPDHSFTYHSGFIEDFPSYREVKAADVIYSIRGTAVKSSSGESYVLEIFEDISEERRQEVLKTKNLERVRRDISMAKEIQHGILPAGGEYWGLVSIDSLYLPADEIGGDLFDVIKVSEDEVLIYMADVSGHGIQASLLTMYISEKMRTRSDYCRAGLKSMVAKIQSDFIELDIDASIYVTALICLYNRKTRAISVVNAGHNCPPLIIRKKGLLEEIHVRGMPLSKISDAESFEAEVISIQPGDRLVLYTDGIVEEYSRAKKKVFGSDGLRRVVEANKALDGGAIAAKIIEASDEYMILNAKDDRTVLVVKIL